MPTEYAVCPNEGLIESQTVLLGKTSFGSAWELMVWANDITPDVDTVFADLVEATFTGYSRITLTPSDWESPTIVDDAAETTWKTVPSTWVVMGSPQTVYGFAIITPTSSVIKSIQRFDEPIVLSVAGVLGVLPRWRYRSTPPP